MKDVDAISSCLLTFIPFPRVVSSKYSVRSRRLTFSAEPVFTEPCAICNQSQGQLRLPHLHAEVGHGFESQHRRHDAKSFPALPFFFFLILSDFYFFHHSWLTVFSSICCGTAVTQSHTHTHILFLTSSSILLHHKLLCPILNGRLS